MQSRLIMSANWSGTRKKEGMEKVILNGTLFSPALTFAICLVFITINIRKVPGKKGLPKKFNQKRSWTPN